MGQAATAEALGEKVAGWKVGATGTGARKLLKARGPFAGRVYASRVLKPGAAIVRQAIGEMRHRAERQMRARIAAIPDGTYEGRAQVDSDGVVDEPLLIRMKVTKKGEDLTFDMTGSSPPCRGPMNSVIATTRSAIYLAVMGPQGLREVADVTHFFVFGTTNKTTIYKIVG